MKKNKDKKYFMVNCTSTAIITERTVSDINAMSQ